MPNNTGHPVEIDTDPSRARKSISIGAGATGTEVASLEPLESIAIAVCPHLGAEVRRYSNPLLQRRADVGGGHESE